MTGALKGLGSRAIIGAFNKRLEELSQASWVGLLATSFTSNQESESYDFLSDAPAMTEWKGPRTRSTLKNFEFTIKNKKFTSGLDIDEDDFRRDKTGQILIRINDLAARAAQLPMKILTTLMNTNGNAYDGVAMWHATNHVTLSGAIVANAVTQAAATGTLPTNEEAVAGIISAINNLTSFLDDAGEPRNEFATSFAIMCPPVLYPPLIAAVSLLTLAAGAQNPLKATEWKISVIKNARLTNAADCFIFRTDSDVKGLVWQDEVPAIMQALVEGSDYHIEHDMRAYFVKRVCNGGYGRFDQSVKLSFT